MDENQFLVKLVSDSWNLQLSRFNQLLASLSDEQLMKPVAPKRSRGIYLLGHLVVVHDQMIRMLFLGEPMYGAWLDVFLTNPDDPVADMPSITELKAAWDRVNAYLADHYAKLSPAEWQQRHTAVSEEDFVKAPNRNRLNLLLNRTNHLSYHYGQLVFLKEK